MEETSEDPPAGEWCTYVAMWDCMPIDQHYKQEVMTESSIRKVYRSRMDSSDVVSVTKVLKLHILERKEQILLQGKFFVFSPESPDFEDCDERTGQLVIKEHTCSPAPFTLAFDSLEKLLKQRC